MLKLLNVHCCPCFTEDCQNTEYIGFWEQDLNPLILIWSVRNHITWPEGLFLIGSACVMDDELSAIAHHHCCREGCAARGRGTRACVFVCYDGALKDGEPRQTSSLSQSSSSSSSCRHSFRTMQDGWWRQEKWFPGGFPHWTVGISTDALGPISSAQSHTNIQVPTLGGLSWWYHARLGFLHTLMHFCLHVWCQHIML